MQLFYHTSIQNDLFGQLTNITSLLVVVGSIHVLGHWNEIFSFKNLQERVHLLFKLLPNIVNCAHIIYFAC
jgi:hypothetical protein